MSKKLIPLLGALALGLLLFVGGGLLGAGAVNGFPALPGFTTTAEKRNEQIIGSVTRMEQVVLLSLGVQGIAQHSESSELFGREIPGTTRTSFIQYSFDAKLGLDGADVTIVSTGENSFLVTIPDFMFIGHDNEKFELIIEDNGVLSFITPEVDHVEMINEILSEDSKHEYVAINDDTLREQAVAFYQGIITSIDPDIIVQFSFAGH